MSDKIDIICEGGKYKDFTGIIMWGDSEGMVENACFKLEEFPLMFVVFYSGAWKNGYWG